MKKYLMTPGPTGVPTEVLLALATPIIHHRTPEFEEVLMSTEERLKKVFGTSNKVITIAGSGTSGMEISAKSIISEGDEVLVIDIGKFGERWVKILNLVGAKIHELKAEWGTVVDINLIKRFYDEHKNIKAVFFQGVDTSTAVCNPVKEIAKVFKGTDVITVMDGITYIGSYDTKMDEVGIDIAIAGSQKAFMLPPGLAMIGISKKAEKAILENSEKTSFYLDLSLELKNRAKNTTAFTPAINMYFGLKKVLDMFEAEGLQNVYARQATNSKAARSALKALGLKLLAKESPANSVTAVFLPEGLDVKAIMKSTEALYGVKFAGGQDFLANKIIRMSHMGYSDKMDVIISISALEMALKAAGYKFEMGTGIAAAQEVLLNSFK